LSNSGNSHATYHTRETEMFIFALLIAGGTFGLLTLLGSLLDS
jgi:hypothetical protein